MSFMEIRIRWVDKAKVLGKIGSSGTIGHYVKNVWFYGVWKWPENMGSGRKCYDRGKLDTSTNY